MGMEHCELQLCTYTSILDLLMLALTMSTEVPFERRGDEPEVKLSGVQVQATAGCSQSHTLVRCRGGETGIRGPIGGGAPGTQ